MAISKDETLPNGIPVSYFRIASLTIVVNQQCIIEVAGYVNQEEREKEQESTIDPEKGCDVFIDTRFVAVDYDPDLSVNKAYELIKAMPEYAGAVDVWDAWAIGESYYIGDIRTYDGKLYECIQSHTSQEGWEPPNVPALWERVQDPSYIPEWVQPTGAHDAYSIGDKVRHNEKTWVSIINANTYEPGVYGWNEV